MKNHFDRQYLNRYAPSFVMEDHMESSFDHSDLKSEALCKVLLEDRI